VRGGRQSSDIGCREDDVARVIASVSEAIQTACAGIWIALGEDSLKVDAVPVTRPGRLAVAKLGRKHAAGTIKGGGDCCQASAKTVARRPSNNVQLVQFVLAWGRDKPKTCIARVYTLMRE